MSIEASHIEQIKKMVVDDDTDNVIIAVNSDDGIKIIIAGSFDDKDLVYAKHCLSTELGRAIETRRSSKHVTREGTIDGQDI